MYYIFLSNTDYGLVIAFMYFSDNDFDVIDDYKHFKSILFDQQQLDL